jgi:hypothetical protein
VAITQVGSWRIGTGAVLFDATPVAGQLLTVKVTLLRSGSAPSFTLPTGWHQAAHIESIPSGSNYVETYLLYRQASEDATPANDTFTLTTNASNNVWESARWTGHDTTTPFLTASSGNTNLGFGAQTTTDTSVTPAAAGIALACTSYRLSSQTLTSFGGGFSTTVDHSGVTGPGSVGIQTTAAGTAYQASVTTGGPGSGSVAVNIITAFFAAAGAPAGTTLKVRASGAWTTAAGKVRSAGSWVASALKIRNGGSWT